MRHNELRDSIAKLLSDVCHDVGIEPLIFSRCQGKLLPLNQQQLMMMQD